MNAHFPGLDITLSPLLKERTSLRLGGPCIAHIRILAKEGLASLSEAFASLGGTVRPIGRGTNILASDAALPCTLVSINWAEPPRVLDEDANSAHIAVDAGMLLPRLLHWAADKGYSGLEGLSGIPGNVGGAICMNAGSYGTETGKTVEQVNLSLPGRGERTLSRPSLTFAYRHFSFACDGEAMNAHDSLFLVTGAVFCLGKDAPAAITGRMSEVMAKKKATQPVNSKSAGCIFKNPAPGISAGKLLDDAGAKGKTEGGMSFSTLHANFLVNNGKGSFEQAMTLVAWAKEAVLAHSGHHLETEVEIWR